VRAASAARFAELRKKVDQELSRRESQLFSPGASHQPVAQPVVHRGAQPAAQPGAHHPRMPELPGGGA